VWHKLLTLGVLLDAVTTYALISSGGSEFNPVAASLIDTIGLLPAIALISAASLLFGLLFLSLKTCVLRAIGIAYAAFRWVPGVHNVLLMFNVPVNPVVAILGQYFAMSLLYTYLLWSREGRRNIPSCRRRKIREKIIRF